MHVTKFKCNTKLLKMMIKKRIGLKIQTLFTLISAKDQNKFTTMYYRDNLNKY